jgi:Domain of unknown function (DUF4349)
MTAIKYLPALFVLALVGCADQPLPTEHDKSIAPQFKSLGPPGEYRAGSAVLPAQRAQASRRGTVPLGISDAYALTDGTAATVLALQPGPAAASAVAPALSRKIIYDAQVTLIVDSVDPVSKKVTALVDAARGYIAELDAAGSPGSQRSMHWKIRVPVERFESFVESIVALGELERNNRTSQDVTEQYYDLEARIKNKRNEEQTLNKILQERSGKLEDVLKIEIELSRVRGEIEQLEGKIRVLENLSALATLTLNVRERDKYAPPAPVVADFSTQVARTWDSSLLGLVNQGKALVLWSVSWVIWVPFLVVGGLLALILVRSLVRRFKRNLPRLIALLRTPITRPQAPSANG